MRSQIRLRCVGAEIEASQRSGRRRRSRTSAYPIPVAHRPFQFMVASRGAPDGRTIAEQARWAESVGYTHIAVHDHLANRHAVTPLLAAVAAVTERIGLVPLVSN